MISFFRWVNEQVDRFSEWMGPESADEDLPKDCGSDEDHARGDTSSKFTQESTKGPENKPKIARAPRIRVKPLHDVVWKVQSETNSVARELPVTNLSVSGLALDLSGIALNEPPLLGLDQVGAKRKGQLKLKNEQIAVEIEVVRVTSNFVGVRFIESLGNLRNRINRYFETELLAIEMKRVDPKFLRADTSEGEPHWYRSSDGAELFLITQENDLKRFTLSFLGFYFEGQEGEPLRFGTIDREFEIDSKRFVEDDSIRFESIIPFEAKGSALRLIEGIEELEPQLVKTLNQWIENESCRV